MVAACFQPDALFRMRSVADPQIRPDGSVIAFTETRADVMDDASYSRVMIARGGDVRPLHDDRVRERGARWSPDGRYLLYASDRTGRSRWHLLDFEQGDERTLDHLPAGASNLAFSPDGGRLAYFSFVEGAPAWDPPMPAKPTGAKWAPAPSVITTLRWAMDGSGVMRPGHAYLFVAPLDGGVPKQISRAPFWHTSYLGTPELDWATDGKSVLAAAVTGPEGWAVYDQNTLWSFPVDGGEPRRMGEPKWHQHRAAASPDGKHVAFVGFPWKGQSYHVGHLYLAGSTVRPMTARFDYDVASPTWSADSRRIFFLADREGDTNLHQVDLAETVRALSSGRHRIVAYSIAADGSAAAIVSTAARPGVLVRHRKRITFTTDVCWLDGSCSSIRHGIVRASD